MKHIKYLLVAGWAMLVLSCTPEDDQELGPVLDPSQLQYTITQEEGYDNRVFFKSETPGAIAYWDYELGTSNRAMDTVIIPFKGDFWVKYRAMGQGGSSVDSTMITVSQFDPNYFSDPAWQLLTNGENGRSWKLVAIKAGDAKSKTFNDWGDAGWLSGVPYNDSAYFDLDKGFNFIRYTKGVPTKHSFSLVSNEVLPEGNYLAGIPGKALVVLQGGKMPAHDPSNEMAPDNKNRFRIYKLSNDTLVLGQGGYYTENRTGEGWTFFHWYIRNK